MESNYAHTAYCQLVYTNTSLKEIPTFDLQPPSLTGLLASTSTSEDNYSQTQVTTVTCTDTIGPVQVTVSELPSNSPNQDLFFAALTTGDGEFSYVLISVSYPKVITYFTDLTLK